MTTPARTKMASHPDPGVSRELCNERCDKLALLIEAAEKLDVERHAAITAKLEAAAEVLEHRLIGLNELRGDVITKGEYNSKHERILVEIAQLKDTIAVQRGREQGKASVWAVVGAYAVAVVSLIAVVAQLIHSMK